MEIVSLTLESPFDGYKGTITIENLNKINVFIGKNNSGKTQLLNQIYRALNKGYETKHILKKITIKIDFPSEKVQLKDFIPEDLNWSISSKSCSNETISSKLSRHELIKKIDKYTNTSDIKQFIVYLRFNTSLVDERQIYSLELMRENEKENKIISFSCKNLIKGNKVFNSLLSMVNVKFLPALRILGSSSSDFAKQNFEDVDNSINKILNSNFRPLDEVNPEVFLIPDLQLLIKHINENKYNQLDRAFVKRFNVAISRLIPNISLNLKYREFESFVSYIEFDRKVDDWKQLGNGTQQLISLLFIFLLPGNFIYLVDEPEIGLHPGLQTKFLYFLQKMVLSQDHYSKQFFFATHSTSFIDFNLDTSHYICEKTQKKFTVDNLRRSNLNIIKDVLGLSPGALLQANGIIWVEGPSDRNYLNMLDEIFGLNLKEKGILIRMTFSKDNVLAGHLTPKMFESSNSNYMIILDSDKESASDNLAIREKRLIKQYRRRGHLVYIPERWRDIEGLLPQSVLNAYYKIDTMNTRFRKKDDFEKLSSYIHELKNKDLIPDEISGYSRKFRDSKKIVETVLANPKLREDVKKSSKINEFITIIQAKINKWLENPEIFDPVQN